MPTRQDMPSGTISSDEIKKIVGDVDETKVIEILELTPSLEDVEQAAIWATGDGDVLSKEGRPLTGIAAQILDILTADEEDEPPAIR